LAIKKSELYSSLWAGCDDLRGGNDASQYQDYVLVLLFVKDVSEQEQRPVLHASRSQPRDGANPRHPARHHQKRNYGVRRYLEGVRSSRVSIRPKLLGG
jgi:hypothetical protein